MDSVHLRALRMVPAWPKDALAYRKGTEGDEQGGHAEYTLINADAMYLIADEVFTSRPRRSFAPVIPFIAGSAGPIPSRMSAWPYWESVVLGTWQCNTRRLRASRPSRFSHSPDKDKMIRELAADEIVRDGKGLSAAGGADIILSTSNSTKSMMDRIQGLRPEGRFIVMAPPRNRFRSH